MHALTRLQQAPKEHRAKLVELLVRLAAHQIYNFLDFLDEDYFLGWTRDGPKFEQARDERHMQVLRLLQIVLHAELQLGIVGRQRLNFVEWDKHSAEEKRVFLLQRGGQAWSDGGQDLEQLRQSIMRLDVILVDDFEEHVHDLRLDVWSQCHEFAVNTMQDGLKVISLTWVLAVEELQEAAYKVVRNVLHDHILAQMNS